MSEILITEAAEVEYTESLRWYAQRSQRAARGFEAEFDRALDSISQDPERFPLCDHCHRFYLLKRYPFQIIFRPLSDDRWLSVAIAHTSRRPGYWSSS